MEPSKRSVLTDMLCAEVTHKLEALEKILTAQGIMSTGRPHIPQGNPLTMEQHALLAGVYGESEFKSL